MACQGLSRVACDSSVTLRRPISPKWTTHDASFAGESGGFALIAVLWMVAALSLLASGLVELARSESRTAAVASDLVKVQALGDAAINLSIVALQVDPIAQFRRHSVMLENSLIEVEVTPATGLIDINQAPEGLLLRLLVEVGGMDEQQAIELAERILVWRTGGQGTEPEPLLGGSDSFSPRGEAFEYPEDLLQVPGVTFDLYAKIVCCIAVLGGTSGVDPMAAPLEVLKLLAHGDMSVALAFAMQRELEGSGDFSGLASEYFSGGFGVVYRIAASVLVDGRWMRRVRWVDLSQPGASGIPWKTLRVEPVVGVEMLDMSEDGN